MYIEALIIGYRCVEIDLWDGPKDEPKVTHGGTLTTEITLTETLKVIK
jgi:phosphatidylinositol phospholipase C delta